MEENIKDKNKNVDVSDRLLIKLINLRKEKNFYKKENKRLQQENKQLKERVGCTTEKCVFKDKIEHYESIDLGKYDKLEEELDARAEVIKRQAYKIGEQKELLDKIKEITPLELAKIFHNFYESYAPKFGYETRKDTREFDENSNNGKLMIEVCKNILNLFKGDE